MTELQEQFPIGTDIVVVTDRFTEPARQGTRGIVVGYDRSFICCRMASEGILSEKFPFYHFEITRAEPPLYDVIYE